MYEVIRIFSIVIYNLNGNRKYALFIYLQNIKER